MIIKNIKMFLVAKNDNYSYVCWDNTSIEINVFKGDVLMVENNTPSLPDNFVVARCLSSGWRACVKKSDFEIYELVKKS